jgi:hypothetical protein
LHFDIRRMSTSANVSRLTLLSAGTAFGGWWNSQGRELGPADWDWGELVRYLILRDGGRGTCSMTDNSF